MFRIVIALIGLLGSLTFAQPLADCVPADALLYVGWRGTHDLGPGFAGSHAEAILRESKISELIDKTIPAAIKTLAAKDPQDAETATTIATLLRSSLRHPTAMFIATPVSAAENGEEVVFRAGIYCNAGPNADTLLAAFEKWAAQIPRRSLARTFRDGDTVCITLGYDIPPRPAVGVGAEMLAGSASFVAAIQQTATEPTVMAFVNIERAIAFTQSIVAREGAAAEDINRLKRAFDASGFDGVKYVAATGTFEERGWRERVFIAAPAPRKGLVALLEPRPFDDTLLARVPASATTLTAVRLDPAKFLATLGSVVDETDKQAGDLFRKGIGAATLAVGKNVQNDLLAPMGDEWVLYTAPDIGDTGLLATVAVSRPKNALKARQALLSLSLFISNSAKTFLKDQSFKIEGRSTQIGDVNVYYFTTPFIAPAWATKDGFVYAGLSPQAVASAASYAGPGIATNKAFSDATKSLGVANPVSISYVDVPTLLPRGHTELLSVTRTALGLSDMYAAPAPEPIVPPLGTFIRESSPSIAASWVDDAGFHAVSRQSFPGAAGIAQFSIQQLMGPNIVTASSILLPSLNRTREAANRIKSATNLRQIGLGCIMYANENRENYPPSLAELLRTQDLTADVFINPRASTALPAAPVGMRPMDFYISWVDQGSDYVYLGKGMKSTAAADKILAYEKPGHLDDGINVLFADGHVDFVNFNDLQAIFNTAGQPMPPIGEN